MQKRQQYTPLPTIASSSQQRQGVNIPQLELQSPGRQRTKTKQPTRTTKTSQKLTLFPTEQQTTPPIETNETYNQIGQLPEGTARIEAEKFSKQEKLLLPRVTAYCTAS
jgi:uncharacterized Rmd1/YagE family protein